MSWLTRHRPVTFDDFWQTRNTGLKLVRRSIEAGALPQLILAVGVLGSGKTSLARVIARRYVCVNTSQHAYNPCGLCPGCKEIRGTDGGTFVRDGYIEYDATAHSPAHIVEGIRGHVVFSRMGYGAIDPRYRQWVVCVDEVARVKTTIQESIIKLVENCTRARFILCYSDPSTIIPPLRSRGVRVELGLPTPDEAATALVRIAGAEGHPLDELVARYVAESLRCVPRDCVKAIEVAACLADTAVITLDAAKAALNLVVEP